jgi:hypothetical protein
MMLSIEEKLLKNMPIAPDTLQCAHWLIGQFRDGRDEELRMAVESGDAAILYRAVKIGGPARNRRSNDENLYYGVYEAASHLEKLALQDATGSGEGHYTNLSRAEMAWCVGCYTGHRQEAERLGLAP